MATGIAWNQVDAWCWCSPSSASVAQTLVETEVATTHGGGRSLFLDLHVQRRGTLLRKMSAATCLIVAAYSLLVVPLYARESHAPTDGRRSSKPLVTPGSPGLAVIVLKNGKVMFQQGYGLANLDARAAIAPDTDFRLASFTKQFTATCIMLLVHDGKLSYDDTLTKIFPGLSAYGDAITVRMLLTHTSGLKDYEDLYSAQFPGVDDRKIPQIKDAQILALMEQQTRHGFSTRKPLALQQYRLRDAGDDCREGFRQAIW